MSKEKSHQEQWGKYIKACRDQGMPLYGAFELKKTDTKSISFDCLEDGQRRGLPAIRNHGEFIKKSDADPREKSCDCVSIPPIPAYIVIKYPEAFVMILIEDFFFEEDNSERKSLTFQRAKEIAVRVIRGFQ